MIPPFFILTLRQLCRVCRSAEKNKCHSNINILNGCTPVSRRGRAPTFVGINYLRKGRDCAVFILTTDAFEVTLYLNPITQLEYDTISRRLCQLFCANLLYFFGKKEKYFWCSDDSDENIFQCILNFTFYILHLSFDLRPVRLRGSPSVRRSAQGDKSELFSVILRSAAFPLCHPDRESERSERPSGGILS